MNAHSIEINRNYWLDDDIWEKISSYPSFIQSGFEELKETRQQYITNGYNAQIQNQSQFNERFLKEFSFLISKTKSLERSFAQAGGIVYGFGFEWGKLKILHYYQKHLKNPFSDNGFFYFLKRDCKKGILKEYGVSCWKDLLEISLKDHTYYRRDRQSFNGYSGLQRAKAYLQNQYNMTAKIPLSDDNGCRLIARAIRRNIWSEFAITTWGDLIYETFGFIKGTRNLWKGGGGLERALSWIKIFYEENGTLPTGKNSDHYNSIRDIVNSKFWMKYGINTMDDLTLKACGTVTVDKRKKWEGIKGLERAKNELKKYYKEHQNKLPTAIMFRIIYYAILSGYWKEYNIESWNGMLMATFGKVNQSHESWIGQTGLDRARKELSEYFNIHQKLPSVSLYSPINNIIKKGYWKEQNIESWNDLLRDIFGRINKDNVTWKGNSGLNRAKKFLREFKIKNKRYPSIQSSLIYGIKRALNKKYWTEYGIFTWNDLIQDIFNENQSEYRICQYFE